MTGVLELLALADVPLASVALVTLLFLELGAFRLYLGLSVCGAVAALSEVALVGGVPAGPVAVLLCGSSFGLAAGSVVMARAALRRRRSAGYPDDW